jgi:hypothetical protein
MKPETVSRRALLGTGAAAALLQALPAVAQSPAKPLVLDDASRLSATPVARHWRPARVTGDAWLGALRAELKAAAAEGRPVALGAARHSMGGQAGSSGSPPARATSTSASSCTACWTCRSGCASS